MRYTHIREYSTHHVDYFYGGLSRLRASLEERRARTHTHSQPQQRRRLLDPAAATLLAGRQQERKNAMALTEDGEEEDEGRERGIKKEAAGWMVACLERERENNNIHSLASATLRGHFFAAERFGCRWMGGPLNWDFGI